MGGVGGWGHGSLVGGSPHGGSRASKRSEYSAEGICLMPPPASAPAVPSLEALAEQVGVAARTLREHRRNGAPWPASGRARDLERWLVGYQAWRLERFGRSRKQDADEPDVDEAEGEAWTAERKKWLALLAKTEWHLRTGRLVPREEVVEFATKAALVVRNRLNSAVSKLAPLVHAAESEEAVEELLQREVDEILETFARGLEPLTVEEVVDADEPAE